MSVKEYQFDKETLERKLKEKKQQLRDIIWAAKVCIWLAAGVGTAAGSLVTWLLLGG